MCALPIWRPISHVEMNPGEHHLGRRVLRMNAESLTEDLDAVPEAAGAPERIREGDERQRTGLVPQATGKAFDLGVQRHPDPRPTVNPGPRKGYSKSYCQDAT